MPERSSAVAVQLINVNVHEGVGLGFDGTISAVGWVDAKIAPYRTPERAREQRESICHGFR